MKNPDAPWQESLETWLLQSHTARLPDEDRAALNTLLRGSCEARAHAARFLMDDTLLSERLRQDRLESFFEHDTAALSTLPENPRSIRPRNTQQFPWRTLMPLAAGLVLGLFSASVVFGYVGSGPLYTRAISLLNESFEAGVPVTPKGAPMRPGHWSGDFSEVTGPAAGISPVHGTKMLRFLRADHLDKMSKSGFNGDVYRILDVRQYAVSFEGGKAMVTAEASFRTIPTEKPAAYDAGLELHAIETLPATPSQFFSPTPPKSVAHPVEDSDLSDEPASHFTPATTYRQVPLAPAGNAWQRIRAELRIPAGTRYVVVGIHLVDRLAGTQKPEHRDVSFPGQFADDVQVRLIPKMPLP